MRTRGSRALLGLFYFLTLVGSSECLQTSVRPDKGSTVTVSTELPLDQCAVCTVSGVNDTEPSCQTSLTLVPDKEVKLLFNCSQPIEQAYTVMITHKVECTKDTCNPSTVETQLSFLTEFTRTFIYELKAPEKTVVSLDMRDGLKETSEPCPDGLQYLVATSKTNEKGQTQYCQGGPVTHLDLPNQATMSLRVKPKTAVTSVSFQASAAPLKGRSMVLTADASTTLVVSRDSGEPDCEVCTAGGSTADCSPTEKTVTNVKNVSLEFSCQTPQDVYSVKITKKIECTTTSCTPTGGEADPNLFKDFKRTLTWDINVPDKTVLTLDFPGGLKEISGAENCQDGKRYSVSTTKNNGDVKTTSYCKGGTVSHLDLLRATTVTVEVTKEGEVDSTAFSAKAAPRGSRAMSVTADPGTIITISRVSNEVDCNVCEVKAPEQPCNQPRLRLKNAANISVEFTCPRPQDVFYVEINKEIDCKVISCSGNVVSTKSLLFPDFNRTFTWDLLTDFPQAIQLDFLETGMQQIPNHETCPDEHTYSLVSYLRTGASTIGTFCKGGSVTAILPRFKGRWTLQVPGHRNLDPVDFKVTDSPDTNMFVTVKVNLPRGVSDTHFFSANYPRDFPDNENMQWDFTVPGMHNYTVHFRDHSAPECLDGAVGVLYQREGKKVTNLSLTLTDPQPEHQQGNFKMVLKNCKTNKTMQGLALSYKVSVMRSGHPVLCNVDLTKHNEVSLQIEKVGSDPYCEMSVDSEVKDKINVSPGTMAKLSFLDCPNEDLRLTASKLIACQNLASCSQTLLSVPKLDSCLRMPLHSFTWHLRMPKDSTVDLTSLSGSLRQSLPGQECNQSFSLHVAESDGLPVGDFCVGGDIRKVQVHANISVTATARDFRKTRGPFLNVSFSQEIVETVIYRVSPKVSSPTLLATPNWPQGMRESFTMSWIVTLPSQYQAHLHFLNVTQPKCKDRHTSMKVKMLGYEEEIMSRREDEQAEEELLVPYSFYLNMSNCVPEDGQFGALTKITLQKKTNILAIVLGVVAALLLLLIVLAVICIIKKKKKDRMNKESSIYIGKGNIFRPGDRHFTKSRSDNESHVYDSIDESMVYGHLLGDSSYAGSLQDHYNGIQVDSYQTFTGNPDGGLPVIKEPDGEPEMDQYKTFLDPSDTFIPSRPRTPIERQDSLGFQDRRMVDNELYTFKSTGDINTIRLSGVDMQPEPTISEESGV